MQQAANNHLVLNCLQLRATHRRETAPKFFNQTRVESHTGLPEGAYNLQIKAAKI